MTPAEIKSLADREQSNMDALDASYRRMSDQQLNDALARLVEEHRPMHESRVRIAMRMMKASREVRLRLLKKAFPKAKVEYVTELCELIPSDHVLGNTEQWIEKMQQNGIAPSRIQVDNTRMVIRVIE